MKRRKSGKGVLSQRVSALEVSPTVRVAQRAAALRAAGIPVLDLGVGEPDQPTPKHIAAAAVAALRRGQTRYTPSAGLPELRAAVAERYRKDHGVAFGDADIAVTCGGKQALYLVCQALLDRKDEVVVPTPHWPTFSEAVRLAGARPVLLQTREGDGFRVTRRLVESVVTPRTKALILNSPCNPTGAVIDAEELLRIGSLARRRSFSLVYDDTYAQLSFRPGPDRALEELRRTIGHLFVIVGTASKTYCMTGWRIGWVMGPRVLVDACTALVSHSTQCPTSFAQVGAVAALRGSQDSVRKMRSEYRRRRDAIYEVISALPDVTCLKPEGGFYLFLNVSRHLAKGASSLDLAKRLLEERHVAVVPGEAFAAPGYVRISFARPMAELEEAARRLASFLSGRERGGRRP